MTCIIFPFPPLPVKGEGVKSFVLTSKTVWIYAIDENKSH
jgi:hypothetical protein